MVRAVGPAIVKDERVLQENSLLSVTVVVGGHRIVQVLAGKTGSTVKITMASRSEISVNL